MLYRGGDFGYSVGKSDTLRDLSAFPDDPRLCGPPTKGSAMLTITEGSHALNRRAFLTAGTLGLGGLTLSSLLAGRAGAAPATLLTGKSVIFLFLQGGPSQFETFDPKPDLPEDSRTVTETVTTSLPGVRFGSTMARLAKLAHKLTVVRSFQTNNAD